MKEKEEGKGREEKKKKKKSRQKEKEKGKIYPYGQRKGRGRHEGRSPPWAVKLAGSSSSLLVSPLSIIFLYSLLSSLILLSTTA